MQWKNRHSVKNGFNVGITIAGVAIGNSTWVNPAGRFGSRAGSLGGLWSREGMNFSISSKRIGLRIGWQGARRFGDRVLLRITYPTRTKSGMRGTYREKSLQVLQKVWRLGSVEMAVLEVGLNRQCCQKAKSRQILR